MNSEDIYLLSSLFLLIVLLIIFIRYESVMKQEQFYKRLLEHSKDGTYYYQIYPVMKYIYVSPSIRKTLGRHEKNFYHDYNYIFDIVHPDDFDALYKKNTGQVDYNKPQIARLLHSNGEYIWTEDYSVPVYDESGRMIGLEGALRDITERKKLEAELEDKSSHDTMTGIYNRDFFEKTFNNFDKYVDNKVGIIMCDLNDLKLLNDNLGHKYGDVMIKESAKILNKYSSENIIVSRIGGDEFAIILTEVDEVHVSNIVKCINDDIIKFNESSEELKIKISIGFALAENSLGNMNLLFVRADKRMYQAKKNMKQSLKQYVN